jgi:hypothetical protein
MAQQKSDLLRLEHNKMKIVVGLLCLYCGIKFIINQCFKSKTQHYNRILSTTVISISM